MVSVLARLRHMFRFRPTLHRNKEAGFSSGDGPMELSIRQGKLQVKRIRD